MYIMNSMTFIEDIYFLRFTIKKDKTKDMLGSQPFLYYQQGNTGA